MFVLQLFSDQEQKILRKWLSKPEWSTNEPMRWWIASLWPQYIPWLYINQLFAIFFTIECFVHGHLSCSASSLVFLPLCLLFSLSTPFSLLSSSFHLLSYPPSPHIHTHFTNTVKTVQMDNPDRTHFDSDHNHSGYKWVCHNHNIETCQKEAKKLEGGGEGEEGRGEIYM